MFADWLEELVCWDDAEYIPRYRAIGAFVSDGLYPFIMDNGYMVRADEKRFAKLVALLLYRNRGISCLDSNIILPQPANSSNEHRWHYDHVLSESRWEHFWRSWAMWSDFTDQRGVDRRIDIQELCWSQLDLDESPQTLVVEELLGISEEYVYMGTHEDPYIADNV
jgi:hypothetical protein